MQTPYFQPPPKTEMKHKAVTLVSAFEQSPVAVNDVMINWTKRYGTPEVVYGTDTTQVAMQWALENRVTYKEYRLPVLYAHLDRVSQREARNTRDKDLAMVSEAVLFFYAASTRHDKGSTLWRECKHRNRRCVVVNP
jgi:hypothetical protein